MPAGGQRHTPADSTPLGQRIRATARREPGVNNLRELLSCSPGALLGLGWGQVQLGLGWDRPRCCHLPQVTNRVKLLLSPQRGLGQGLDGSHPCQPEPSVSAWELGASRRADPTPLLLLPDLPPDQLAPVGPVQAPLQGGKACPWPLPHPIPARLRAGRVLPSHLGISFIPTCRDAAAPGVPRSRCDTIPPNPAKGRIHSRNPAAGSPQHRGGVCLCSGCRRGG